MLAYTSLGKRFSMVSPQKVSVPKTSLARTLLIMAELCSDVRIWDMSFPNFC
jgi:hypothetical protein